MQNKGATEKSKYKTEEKIEMGGETIIISGATNT